MRFVLFLLFPALELYLLVKVGGLPGALNMVAWVFASALIGMWAVRAQGQSAMQKARAEMEAGRVPQTPFLDGVLLFLGGILLILPGLITDAVGLLLLIPPFRRMAALALAAYITSRQAASASGASSGSGGATRIFFFSSSGFPGSNTPPRHDPSMHIGPERSGLYDASHEEPRQATIIESTAIAIEKPASRDGAGNTPPSSSGMDGSENDNKARNKD